MNRADCLKEIVEFGARIEEAKTRILDFGFDSDKEIYRLSEEIFLNVAEMYLVGSISSRQLENWANFIECREDINYTVVSEQIYTLANSSLTYEVTVENVKQIALELRNS